MFTKRFKLFSLFGFEIRIDSSWIFLAFLIVWTLASGYFPLSVRNLSPGDYWIMGISGAIGLFLSIILHEMCHSLVARKYGIPMKGITLFIFGGIAEMHEEPKNAKTEFLMAAAGPLCSVGLSVLFFAVYFLGINSNWPVSVNAVIYYLSFINLALAAFNMLPAFPLDGGRILRALLWYRKKDIKKATRIASKIGSAFGYIFIALGILSLLGGNFLGAIWWVLIGMFLNNIAGLSYQQVLTREVLAGEPVSRLMNPEPIGVPPSITLDDFVQNYVYRFHHKMFPVIEGEKLVGCISTGQIRDIPRDQWKEKIIGEVLKKCSMENTVNPNTDAIKALARMNQTGNTRLLVIDKDRLLGTITLKDILQFLSVKLDLEGYEGSA